jgi:hypothetical protein
MKYMIVVIVGKALSLMIFGLVYLMLRRTLRTWLLNRNYPIEG